MAIEWSVKRRLTYLAIIIALALVALAATYVRYKPAPTCQDLKLNQGELGVDCGGPCPQVCSFEVRALRALWSRVFEVTPGRYDVATLVRNPNPGYTARAAKYRIKVYDASNIQLATREGEFFLNPSESFFIYEPRLEVGNRVPARATFEIIDGPTWQRVAPEPIKLTAAYKSYTASPPLLTAEIHNDSLKSLRDVTIVAILSDENENALAVSSTLVEGLEKGEEREVAFTWPEMLTVQPTFFEFYPHFDYALAR